MKKRSLLGTIVRKTSSHRFNDVHKNITTLLSALQHSPAGPSKNMAFIELALEESKSKSKSKSTITPYRKEMELYQNLCMLIDSNKIQYPDQNNDPKATIKKVQYQTLINTIRAEHPNLHGALYLALYQSLTAKKQIHYNPQDKADLSLWVARYYLQRQEHWLQKITDKKTVWTQASSNHTNAMTQYLGLIKQHWSELNKLKRQQASQSTSMTNQTIISAEQAIQQPSDFFNQHTATLKQAHDALNMPVPLDDDLTKASTTTLLRQLNFAQQKFSSTTALIKKNAAQIAKHRTQPMTADTPQDYLNATGLGRETEAECKVLQQKMQEKIQQLRTWLPNDPAQNPRRAFGKKQSFTTDDLQETHYQDRHKSLPNIFQPQTLNPKTHKPHSADTNFNLRTPPKSTIRNNRRFSITSWSSSTSTRNLRNAPPQQPAQPSTQPPLTQEMLAHKKAWHMLVYNPNKACWQFALKEGHPDLNCISISFEVHNHLKEPPSTESPVFVNFVDPTSPNKNTASHTWQVRQSISVHEYQTTHLPAQLLWQGQLNHKDIPSQDIMIGQEPTIPIRMLNKWARSLGEATRYHKHLFIVPIILNTLIIYSLKTSALLPLIFTPYLPILLSAATACLAYTGTQLIFAHAATFSHQIMPKIHHKLVTLKEECSLQELAETFALPEYTLITLNHHLIGHSTIAAKTKVLLPAQKEKLSWLDHRKHNYLKAITILTLQMIIVMMLPTTASLTSSLLMLFGSSIASCTLICLNFNKVASLLFSQPTPNPHEHTAYSSNTWDEDTIKMLLSTDEETDLSALIKLYQDHNIQPTFTPELHQNTNYVCQASQWLEQMTNWADQANNTPAPNLKLKKAPFFSRYSRHKTIDTSTLTRLQQACQKNLSAQDQAFIVKPDNDAFNQWHKQQSGTFSPSNQEQSPSNIQYAK
jgi:hypothetical protein